MGIEAGVRGGGSVLGVQALGAFSRAGEAGPDLGGRPGLLEERKFKAKTARCVPRRRVSLVPIRRESSGRFRQLSLRPPGHRKGSSWKERGGF